MEDPSWNFRKWLVFWKSHGCTVQYVAFALQMKKWNKSDTIVSYTKILSSDENNFNICGNFWQRNLKFRKLLTSKVNTKWVCMNWREFLKLIHFKLKKFKEDGKRKFNIYWRKYVYLIFFFCRDDSIHFFGDYSCKVFNRQWKRWLLWLDHNS